MSYVWAQDGKNFYIRHPVSQATELKPGIYTLSWDAKRSEFYLAFSQVKYEFGYKLYNLDTEFINRVVKSYENLKGNVGVLMNGVKGSGKTVTAKQICNLLNKPVIVIEQSFTGIPTFINSIGQDVVIFIDEYEKVFSRNSGDGGATLLSIMDGALENGFRRLFLLTTNDLYVNINMIQRPGRIRYIKSYSDLPLSVIIEIVNDRLKHKEWHRQTVEFISKLEIITVDVIGAIVDEVNIHNHPPAMFEDVFNVKKTNNFYNIYQVIDREKNETKVLYKEVPLEFSAFHDGMQGYRIRAEGTLLGYVYEAIDPTTAVLAKTSDECYTDDDGKKKFPDNAKTIRIEPTDGKHKNFKGYTYSYY